MIASLFFWMGRASADEIDNGMREQYKMEYGINKGRSGFSCRQDKYFACWKESHKNDTWFKQAKDTCPGVHSVEMYEACRDAVEKTFPDLERSWIKL